MTFKENLCEEANLFFVFVFRKICLISFYPLKSTLKRICTLIVVFVNPTDLFKNQFSLLFVVYAEVVTFWGSVVRQYDCQLYKNEYTNWKKTLKTFLKVFVHFICKQRFENNITEVSKWEDIKIRVSSSRCSR